MASGGDGGGSIRIPASCCGLFGLKPSRGTTPTGPEFGELWRGFTIEHAISRSVRDSAALLDATAGADLGAPYSAPAQARPFLDEVRTEPGRLRIAFTRRPLFGRSVHADCVAGLEAGARLLESLGHSVEEATPPVDGEACAVAFVTILAGEVRAEIEAVSRLAGRRPRGADFEAATYSLGLLGHSLSAAEYASAARALQVAMRSVAPFFEQYDVLLTPTLGRLPAPLGLYDPVAPSPLRDIFATWAPLESFLPVFNATGQPAISLPLHQSVEGLPIGMQLVGASGAESLLLRLAAQLEEAAPWSGRRPPLHVGNTGGTGGPGHAA